jgi:RNA polymerase sigma-70 factor (ECF subfamily)
LLVTLPTPPLTGIQDADHSPGVIDGGTAAPAATAPAATVPASVATPDPVPPRRAEPDPRMVERFHGCLTKEYRRALYFFILRRVGLPEDAEDLAQQALVEAARNIASFRGDAEMSTWIYGIALNLARNHVTRSPNRRHVFESDEVLEETEAPHSDPCDQASQRQELTRLSEALGQLREGSVQALMLVAVDGLSYEEAALELGVPVGTIRSRVSRARAEVRQRLLGAAARPQKVTPCP